MPSAARSGKRKTVGRGQRSGVTESTLHVRTWSILEYTEQGLFPESANKD